jgi:hypothetical protein
MDDLAADHRPRVRSLMASGHRPRVLVAASGMASVRNPAQKTSRASARGAEIGRSRAAAFGRDQPLKGDAQNLVRLRACKARARLPVLRRAGLLGRARRQACPRASHRLGSFDLAGGSARRPGRSPHGPRSPDKDHRGRPPLRVRQAYSDRQARNRAPGRGEQAVPRFPRSVPGQGPPRKAAEIAAFYADAAPMARRLAWAQSDSLERLGIEADFIGAGLQLDGIGPVRAAMHAALDQLNDIRAELWGTAVAVGA